MALNLLRRSPGRLFWLGGIASIVLFLGAGIQFRNAEAEEYYFSTGGCTNAYAGSYYDGFQLVSTTVKPSSGTCTYIYQLADFDTYLPISCPRLARTGLDDRFLIAPGLLHRLFGDRVPQRV